MLPPRCVVADVDPQIDVGIVRAAYFSHMECAATEILNLRYRPLGRHYHDTSNISHIWSMLPTRSSVLLIDSWRDNVVVPAAYLSHVEHAPSEK